MSTITRFGFGPLSPLDRAHQFLFPLLTPSIPIEDFRDGDRYVVRAEIPGVDPAKDIKVTFTDGALRLDVERVAPASPERDHAEFHYGTSWRILPMPAGIQEKNITARYTDGILEITSTINDVEPTTRRIAIKVEPPKAETGKKN